MMEKSASDGVDIKKILDEGEEKERREAETQMSDIPVEPAEQTEQKQKEAQKANRYVWMTNEHLKVCERGKLKSAEKMFWTELIETYLKPIKSTAAEMKLVAEGLASLRNQIAFTILLINTLLAMAIILIQKHNDVLSIKYSPYKGFRHTKMNEMTSQFELTDKPLRIDPLGMGIVVFLLIILFVQTLGMLVHRLVSRSGESESVLTRMMSQEFD